MSRTLTDHRKIERLEKQVADLQKALGTLISWAAQSANSPIRHDEAARLVSILEGRERP